MDPYGHHTHTHHHQRRDDDDDRREEDYPPPPQVHHVHHRRDEEEYPPPPLHSFDGPRPTPPPSYYGGATEIPPPSNVYHSSHSHGGGGGPTPPPSYYGGATEIPPPSNVYHSSHSHGGGGGGGGGGDYYSQTPPPPAAHNFEYSGSGYPPPNQQTHYSSSYSEPVVVQHVSHESPHQSEIETNPHHHRPHLPSFLHHHQHQQGSEGELAAKPTVRVYSKAETNYSLTIRDGKVILAPSNPSDPFQHWIKDEKLSTRVKDEEGFPSFALVNKAAGLAMKHSIGATHPVQLIPYNPDVLDESVLWTLSKDLGDSYRTIRMVNNIRLNVDAFNGDQNHGGVKDGTTIVLWEWKKGDNQRWKIVPY